MSISISSPITGGAQTGFTSPTYTNVTDTATDVNSKQVAVTALGGTQAGVVAHSISSPFTIAVFRPKIPASLPNPNPVTGRYGPIPMNRHAFVVRKGVSYAANQSPVTATARVTIDIPAGADTYDAANVRALVSALVGVLSQQSSNWGDTAVTGIL